MRVRIQKRVDVDTEVNVDLDDIREAIAESVAYATARPSAFSVCDLVKNCCQCLNALTDEQIRLCGPTNIAASLRRLAERFENASKQEQDHAERI